MTIFDLVYFTKCLMKVDIGFMTWFVNLEMQKNRYTSVDLWTEISPLKRVTSYFILVGRNGFGEAKQSVARHLCKELSQLTGCN